MSLGILPNLYLIWTPAHAALYLRTCLLCSLLSGRILLADIDSITANHYRYAADTGVLYFFLLLEALIADVNNISVEEVNTVHAAILFKGHSKDKTCARSYRTISTCPLVAKAQAMYLCDLKLDAWNADQAQHSTLGMGAPMTCSPPTYLHIVFRFKICL